MSWKFPLLLQKTHMVPIMVYVFLIISNHKPRELHTLILYDLLHLQSQCLSLDLL